VSAGTFTEARVPVVVNDVAHGGDARRRRKPVGRGAASFGAQHRRQRPTSRASLIGRRAHHVFADGCNPGQPPPPGTAPQYALPRAGIDDLLDEACTRSTPRRSRTSAPLRDAVSKFESCAATATCRGSWVCWPRRCSESPPEAVIMSSCGGDDGDAVDTKRPQCVVMQMRLRSRRGGK
jgi:hypothetical protein